MLAVMERALRDLGPTVDSKTREEASAWFSGESEVSKSVCPHKWTFQDINDEWEFSKKDMEYLMNVYSLSIVGEFPKELLGRRVYTK